MRTLKRLNEIFEDFLSSERRKAERRPVPDFVAYYPLDSELRVANIKDISSTGAYLITEDRWEPGTILPLTLQKRGPLEQDPERRVTLTARTVRWGGDGVGMAFDLPKELNFDLWLSVDRSAQSHAKPIDILAPFRMAQALAFLSRICPTKAEELRQLVRTGLGNLRITNAVDIALEADQILWTRPDYETVQADPKTIILLIEDGSWADEDSVKRLWGGLLASYCSTEDKKDTDVDPIERFSQLAPVHVSMLQFACLQSTKTCTETGSLIAQPLNVDIRYIQRITGSQSPEMAERDIQHLSHLGLFEPSLRSRSLLPAKEVDMTPSALGLMLYARCNGHFGSLADYYGTADEVDPQD